MKFTKVAQLKTVAGFRERLTELGLELPLDDAVLTAEQASPMAESFRAGPLEIGNRWCIHPMEGWDANPDGSPSELTLRRWKHFGRSGAKLIWGGEAAAVRPDGRANPNQTLATEANTAGLERLRETLVEAHQDAMGSCDGLVVGLQLTHSGRFCKPNRKDRFEPRIAYHHPLLDAKYSIAANDEAIVWTDTQLDELIQDYVKAAHIAQRLGFDFVDVKACHGYLLHEFLSARSRKGRYGGSFANRTRLLLEIIRAIRSECHDLEVGVRLSLFDSLPYQQGETAGIPTPFEGDAYEFGFGCSAENPLEIDLEEPLRLIGELASVGVRMVNLTAGSPYYNPHIQRPAIFPPSDGYRPPEDPLCGVVRQIQATRAAKCAFPDMVIVGSGYTYLQDYLPHVAQAVVRDQWVDSVGLGRMVLSYPQLPVDTLSGQAQQRKLVCRTFSDCTTAPRQGMVSGCYPLDPFYKSRPEREQLQAWKKSHS